MSQNQNLGNLGQSLTVNTAANTVSVNAQFIVGNSVSNVVVNSSSISIGGTPINTTSFAGTANNTLYVGTVTAANVVSNAQLQANVTTLQGQITSNASAAYSNSVTYIDTKIGTANSAMIANAGAAYTNAVSYTDGKILTANSAITGNAATAYTNAVSYTDTKIGTANTAIAANAAAAYSNSVTYTDTKIGTANAAITANASAAYTNAIVFAANVSTVNTGTLAEARLPYRMNQNVRNTDTVEFGGMTLTGNLVVSGNVNIVGANNLSLVDNMIYLNANNNVTNPDLGIAGNYNDGTYHHAGIFRDHNDGSWKVFDNYLPEPDANIYIQTTNTTFHLANFQANTYYGGNTSTNWFIANTGGITTSGYANVATTLKVGTNTSTFGTAAYIVANGNVGIACTSPEALLDMGSSIATTNTVYAILARPSGGDGNFKLTTCTGSGTTAGSEFCRLSFKYGSATTYHNAGIGFYRGGDVIGGFMSFHTSNWSEAMRIDASQYVGIGTTTPSSRLTVSDHVSITNSGGAQYLLMGNQDSGGVNKPGILRSYNGGIFEFGYGTSWSTSGGTFTRTVYIDNSGYLEGASSLRAPVFYDSNDTGYYVNPNSSSAFYGSILVGPNAYGRYTRFGAVGPATDEATIAASNGNLHIDCKEGYALYLNYSATGTINMCQGGGYTYSAGSMRSPIFYDSDDTGYYTNPNSQSNFNTLSVATINGSYTTSSSRFTFSSSQNVGTLQNSSGSLGGIELYGGGGTNAAFMTFHRPGSWAAYFGLDNDNQFAVGGWSYGAQLGDFKCKSLGVGTAASVSNGRIYAAGELYSTIFYDYNNTGFYCDPNATSALSTITAYNVTLTPDQPSSSTPTADTTNGFRIRAANYTGGQYDHRFVKPDMGGGIPLYIQYSGGTAGSWANAVRIGTYSGDTNMLYVYGNAYVTGNFYAPGTVVQVIQTVKTSTSAVAISANTYNEFDSGFRVTITPRSSSSKIAITACITGAQNTGTIRYKFQYSTNSGSTWSDVPYQGDANASHGQAHFGYAVNGDTNQYNTCSMELIHSPATTSAIVYRVLFGADVGTTYYFNRSISYPNSFLGCTLASTFIAKEIAA